MNQRLNSIIRTTIKETRNRLTHAYQSTQSKIICKKLQKTNDWRMAKRVAMYLPIQNEVDLTWLWQQASMHGKFCYFPVMMPDNSLIFLPATPKTAFIEHRFGIKEPDVNKDLAINPDNLDIIVMPLVAFDAFGHRLGQGAGCYDKTLAEVHKPKRIGVAYEFQKQDVIFKNPWDVSMDMVITQVKVYDFSSKHHPQAHLF